MCSGIHLVNFLSGLYALPSLEYHMLSEFVWILKDYFIFGLRLPSSSTSYFVLLVTIFPLWVVHDRFIVVFASSDLRLTTIIAMHALPRESSSYSNFNFFITYLLMPYSYPSISANYPCNTMLIFVAVSTLLAYFQTLPISEKFCTNKLPPAWNISNSIVWASSIIFSFNSPSINSPTSFFKLCHSGNFSLSFASLLIL